MGVLEDVMEQYPTLAFLLGDSEIGPLLRDAVDPNKGYSEPTFQSKLYQTNWWKSKSSSEREWLIKSHTDPGTANQERGSYQSALALAASQYGVRLTGDQLKWLSEVGLARGMDPSGHEMVYELSKLRNASNATPGAMRTTAREVQKSMRRDYGYQMSNKHAAQWADWIVRGVKTMDDMRTTVAGRAAQLYPQYKTGLDQGFTISELTDGFREIIASELELDPERIDFSEGRWSKVLSWKDGKDGPLRVPTAEEVRKLARQDERWWKTSHGKQTDAGMTRNFLALFGKRASMGMGS